MPRSTDGLFIRIDWENLVDENTYYRGVSDRKELAGDTLTIVSKYDIFYCPVERKYKMEKINPDYDEDDIWE